MGAQQAPTSASHCWAAPIDLCVPLPHSGLQESDCCHLGPLQGPWSPSPSRIGIPGRQLPREEGTLQLVLYAQPLTQGPVYQRELLMLQVTFLSSGHAVESMELSLQSQILMKV